MTTMLSINTFPLWIED